MKTTNKLFRTCGIITVFAALGVLQVFAFPTYAPNNCSTCHGDFNGGSYTSLVDGTAWGLSLMNGHLSFIDGDFTAQCQTCHMTPGSTPVNTNLSGGPIRVQSCAGCHGRDEEITANDGAFGSATPGRADGLRAHHASAGITLCAGCHIADAVQVGEEIEPFNFRPDGGNVLALTDSCNDAQFGPFGLDNDGDGPADSADSDCISNQAPIADANGPYNAQVNDTITFDGSGSFDTDGNIVNYAWDFGDGTAMGMGVMPTHVYGSPGTFPIALTVTDDMGATDSAATTATISAQPLPPIADPGGPYNAQVGATLTFDGSGSFDPDGNIVSYSWNFGDGTALGAGAMPTHIYGSSGNFTVTLNVTDNDGLTDSASTTASIGPAVGDSDGDGVADVVDNCTNVANPDQIDTNGDGIGNLCDGDVVGANQGPEDCFVNFADHRALVEAFFTTANQPGYDPDLDFNSDGAINFSDLTLMRGFFFAPPGPSATKCVPVGNIAPTANANGPYTGTESVPLQFSSAGSMDPDGQFITFFWDFGDGSTSTLKDPVHTYAAAATYNVTLTVTDDVGDTGSDSTIAIIEAIQVNVPPTADANGPYSAFVNDTIVFDGSASSDPDGTIVRYDWRFGDGSTALNGGVMPSHAYTVQGTYTVELTVTDNLGATGSASTTAAINAAMTAGETQYNTYCVACHGDPWAGPAVDPGLVAGRRNTGARECSINGALFGTSVFPGGVPLMQSLQGLVNSGALNPQAVSDYLNSQPVTGEQRYVASCAGCHGNDASGGRVDRDIRGDDADKIFDAIIDENAMMFLSCLPSSDIFAIASYLETLDDGN